MKSTMMSMRQNKTTFFLALASLTLLIVGCSKNKQEKSTESSGKPVYCSACGTEAAEPTKYCSNCGAEAKWTVEKVSSTQKQVDNIPSNVGQDVVDDKPVIINRRSEYINKLDQVEKSMSDLDDLFAGTTYEMRQATSECFDRWDKILNEIYGLLKQQLPASQMEELRKKQVAWIKYRDKTAKTKADRYSGGTMEPLVYGSSLCETTKARCYKLVNTYME